MNRLLFVLFFLARGFSAARAQNEIYVPYRSGKLWGIADYAGKMIIEPRYDSIAPDKSNFIFLKTFKEGKQGLIINGREVLPNNYDEIAPVEEMYISALSAQGAMILDFYGNPINTKPARTITCYRMNTEGLRALIFHIFYHDDKEDLIAWDLNKRQMHYLFQNYASVKFKKPYADISKLDLLFRKNDADLLKEETYTLENFKLKKAEPKAQAEVVAKDGKDYPYTDFEPSLSNVPSGRGNEEPGLAGFPSGPGKPPREEDNKTIRKGVSIVSMGYLIRKDTVFLNRSSGAYPAKQPIRELVSLPKNSTNIAVHAYRSYIDVEKNKDTMLRYYDYITFNNKGKKGLLSGEQKALLYDTIMPVFYVNYKTGKSDVAFLIGDYEGKTKKMRYGIVNVRSEEILPVSFDSIIVNANFQGRDFNYWTVVRGDKFGIIQPDGTIIIEPVYDSIANKRIELGYGNFLQLKALPHKYGILIGVEQSGPLFVTPVFDYPVKNVYLKYPFIEYNQSRPYEKEFGAIGQKAIIVLEDQHKKMVGYANAEGRLYFND